MHCILRTPDISGEVDEVFTKFTEVSTMLLGHCEHTEQLRPVQSRHGVSECRPKHSTDRLCLYSAITSGIGRRGIIGIRATETDFEPQAG